MIQRTGLWQGFVFSAERFSDRAAIRADGSELSYAQLREAVRRIAATLQARREFSSPTLTSVFAYRSTTAFEGVLGALLAGNGYVPLNRTFPVERTQIMFERSGSRSIVVDLQSLPQLGQLLDRADSSVLVIIPDLSDGSELRSKWPRHVFVGRLDL